MTYRETSITDRLHHNRRADRSIDELIGICKGIVADGVVTEGEAKFLMEWLESNSDAIDVWPANVIYPRLVEIFEDGRMDDEEEGDLLKMLMDLGARPKAITNATSAASFLPLCDPAPKVSHEGNVFVLTGTFMSGTRAEIARTIEAKGGKVSKNVNGKTAYLVIGEVGSKDWAHSTHGRKIEAAVELRKDGDKPHIISEEHWHSSLS